MIECTCVEKFRNKSGVIIGYRLKDATGNLMDFDANDVKNGIRNKEVRIDNLTLTSDDRIIDKNPVQKQNTNDFDMKYLFGDEQPKKKSNEMRVVSPIIDNNRLVGYAIECNDTIKNFTLREIHKTLSKIVFKDEKIIRTEIVGLIRDYGEIIETFMFRGALNGVDGVAIHRYAKKSGITYYLICDKTGRLIKASYSSIKDALNKNLAKISNLGVKDDKLVELGKVMSKYALYSTGELSELETEIRTKLIYTPGLAQEIKDTLIFCTSGNDYGNSINIKGIKSYYDLDRIREMIKQEVTKVDTYFLHMCYDRLERIAKVYSGTCRGDEYIEFKQYKNSLTRVQRIIEINRDSKKVNEESYEYASRKQALVMALYLTLQEYLGNTRESLGNTRESLEKAAIEHNGLIAEINKDNEAFEALKKHNMTVPQLEREEDSVYNRLKTAKAVIELYAKGEKMLESLSKIQTFNRLNGKSGEDEEFRTLCFIHNLMTDINRRTKNSEKAWKRDNYDITIGERVLELDKAVRELNTLEKYISRVNNELVKADNEWNKQNYNREQAELAKIRRDWDEYVRSGRYADNEERKQAEREQREADEWYERYCRLN